MWTRWEVNFRNVRQMDGNKPCTASPELGRETAYPGRYAQALGRSTGGGFAPGTFQVFGIEAIKHEATMGTQKQAEIIGQ